MDSFILKPKYYAAISMLMTLIAVLFLYVMGSTLVRSTKNFRQGYAIELNCR